MRKPKPCPVCGCAMDRQSKICRTCYLSNSARPHNYVERRCKQCSRSFTIHVAQTRRPGEGQYCSRPCARSGSPTRPKKTPVVECWTCGKEFNKYRAAMKKTVGDKHFCSPGCWYSHNQRDNHYLWTGGQNERMCPEAMVWRKAVLRRDKKYCRICHATTRLEAHHILPFGKHCTVRWDVANGITLCHSCHVKTFVREEEYVEALQLIASIELVVLYVDPDEESVSSALTDSKAANREGSHHLPAD